MMWLQAPVGLLAFFVIWPAFVLALIVAGITTASRKVGVGPADRQAWTWLAAASAVTWFVFTGLLAASGTLLRFDRLPPPFMLAVTAALLVTTALAFSRVGTRLVRGLPMAALVGFQAFRLPLELMMHRAAAEGIMPVQMSYSGRNWDVLTGITALAVAWVVRRQVSWGLVCVWNALGTLLLVNVVGIAVASLPVFQAFGTAPDLVNTWVTYAPFAWLPLILVPAALFGHLLVWRWLFSRDLRQSAG